MGKAVDFLEETRSSQRATRITGNIVTRMDKAPDHHSHSN